MISYNGVYIESDGSQTPFEMVANGSKLSILYDDAEKKIVKTLRILHNANWVWKLNEKSVTCRSVVGMIERFRDCPAYARATFKRYCRQ